ncbi:hypothetical protein A33M_0112 [Rhodovulum sp. PH10]|nr:hypothetical protein A33M_0112 [Rhodovulum sp. PH10]
MRLSRVAGRSERRVRAAVDGKTTAAVRPVPADRTRPTAIIVSLTFRKAPT